MKKSFGFNCNEYTIKSITLDDADVIVKWRSDPEIIKYFYNSTPLTKEKHLHWYNNFYLNDETQYHFMVFKDNYPIGFLMITDLNLIELSCEIGYTLAEKSLRGKNVMGDITISLIDFAKAQWGITHFFAGMNKDNLSSVKFIEKLGFSSTNIKNEKYIYYEKILK